MCCHCQILIFVYYFILISVLGKTVFYFLFLKAICQIVTLFGLNNLKDCRLKRIKFKFMIITDSVINLYHFDNVFYVHHHFFTQVIYETLLCLCINRELKSAINALLHVTEAS